MNQLKSNPTGQAGRVLIITAFTVTIAVDLFTDLIWFSKFGFRASKLGSILVTAIFFYFTYRGSPIARWLTVAFSAFALIMVVASGLSLHPLMILISSSSLAVLIMLSLPQVGYYQHLKKL